MEKTNHTSTLSNKTIRPQSSLVAANPSFIHHPNLSISNPALQSTGLTGMFPPSFTHHHHPYRVPSSQPSKTTFTVITTRDLDTRPPAFPKVHRRFGFTLALPRASAPERLAKPHTSSTLFGPTPTERDPLDIVRPCMCVEPENSGTRHARRACPRRN